MRILLVDDEALARQRLRDLLAECRVPQLAQQAHTAFEVTEAAQADQAWQWLQQPGCDVVLLDICMPGMDGRDLAAKMQTLPHPPAVVFVTAHAEHALQAFELAALDYLTKPVRASRLQQALDKAAHWLGQRPAPAEPVPAPGADFLLIHERARTERVPLAEVLYLKAELKYVTVRTAARSYIYDGSLHELEQAHPQRWLRVHRNALVAKTSLRALEPAPVPEGEVGAPGETHEGWWLRLHGVDEVLAVSRRQLPLVRAVLAGKSAC